MREVGLSVRSAYNLRNAPGGEGFATAWRKILSRAADRLLDVMFEQAIVGEEIPVYDQDGVRVGVRWKHNTRVAMFLLRAYFPERFRFAHKDTRQPDEALPQPALPVAEVVASLAPVPPTDPQLLDAPGQAWRIEDARKEMVLPAEQAPDERERWSPVTVPQQPGRVHARAMRRRASRLRREEREQEINEREGFSQPPPDSYYNREDY